MDLNQLSNVTSSSQAHNYEDLSKRLEKLNEALKFAKRTRPLQRPDRPERLTISIPSRG